MESTSELDHALAILAKHKDALATLAQIGAFTSPLPAPSIPPVTDAAPRKSAPKVDVPLYTGESSSISMRDWLYAIEAHFARHAGDYTTDDDKLLAARTRLSGKPMALIGPYVVDGALTPSAPDWLRSWPDFRSHLVDGYDHLPDEDEAFAQLLRLTAPASGANRLRDFCTDFQELLLHTKFRTDVDTGRLLLWTQLPADIKSRLRREVPEADRATFDSLRRAVIKIENIMRDEAAWSSASASSKRSKPSSTPASSAASPPPSLPTSIGDAVPGGPKPDGARDGSLAVPAGLSRIQWCRANRRCTRCFWNDRHAYSECARPEGVFPASDTASTSAIGVDLNPQAFTYLPRGARSDNAGVVFGPEK